MDFKQNYLLATLPENTYNKLIPHLKLIHLLQGQILHLPNEIVPKVYFPLDCLLSITVTLDNGNAVETGIIGNQDLLGINALISDCPTSHTEYIVQVSGAAVQIQTSTIREIFQEDYQFRDLMLRYTQAFIAQVSQTAACNRLHLLEQRLAKWLLQAGKCLNSNEIPLTQEFLSIMLGVRRPAVTLTVQKLYERGCISYSRGSISIIDREKLQNSSCECFEVIGQEYARFLDVSNLSKTIQATNRQRGSRQ
jgi:CRP-like cAMP-binding protein